VLLVRRIRDLLYEQGFTISGARNRLGEAMQASRRKADAAVRHDNGEPSDGQVAFADSMADEAIDSIRAELEQAIALLGDRSASAG
jgi:hypothetical protein